jgi:hypothetical protein
MSRLKGIWLRKSAGQVNTIDVADCVGMLKVLDFAPRLVDCSKADTTSPEASGSALPWLESGTGTLTSGF